MEVALHRLLTLVALFAVAAVAAFAGGPVILEEGGPEVIEEGTRQMNWILPLLIVAIVGIAVASGDGDDY
jgi:hypothetical protein